MVKKLLSIFTQTINGDAITADNGRLAVEAFEKDNFSVVLMDIMMPEMDGIEASRRIRDFEKNSDVKQTPIIAVTAYEHKNKTESLKEAGINCILSKPICFDTLKRTIKEFIDE